jgi:hypothetical protein
MGVAGDIFDLVKNAPISDVLRAEIDLHKTKFDLLDFKFVEVAQKAERAELRTADLETENQKLREEVGNLKRRVLDFTAIQASEVSLQAKVLELHAGLQSSREENGLLQQRIHDLTSPKEFNPIARGILSLLSNADRGATEFTISGTIGQSMSVTKLHLGRLLNANLIDVAGVTANGTSYYIEHAGRELLASLS